MMELARKYTYFYGLRCLFLALKRKNLLKFVSRVSEQLVHWAFSCSCHTLLPPRGVPVGTVNGTDTHGLACPHACRAQLGVREDRGEE